MSTEPTPENLRKMRRALALELPGPVYDDVAVRIDAAADRIETLERIVRVTYGSINRNRRTTPFTHLSDADADLLRSIIEDGAS